MNDSIKTHENQSQKSITVHVKLSGFLSKLTPENDFDMSIPVGCTVAEFVEYLVERLGEDFRKTLLENDGRPHTDYAIVLNQHFIAPQRLKEMTIRDKSRLNIIPIIGGG